jgi:drug/metabolite transporter (DMT)-like permease
MPLGQAVALHFTVPLIVVLLAVMILGERPKPLRWAATLIGFCGVLVILRPGLIAIGLPAMMVLGSALSYAGVGIYSRVLGRTDAPAVTTFYYQLMLTLFAAVPTLMVWRTPGLNDVPALILVAFAGTVAPYCLIRAYMHAEASMVAPIDFLRLPFTTLMAIFLFAEPTELWTWVGAAIIFASTTFITRREAKAARTGGQSSK